MLNTSERRKSMQFDYDRIRMSLLCTTTSESSASIRR
jgi:hypothetical protein